MNLFRIHEIAAPVVESTSNFPRTPSRTMASPCCRASFGASATPPQPYLGVSQEVCSQRPLGRASVIFGSVGDRVSTVAEAVIRKPLMPSRAQAVRWVGGGGGPLKQHDFSLVTGQN